MKNSMFVLTAAFYLFIGVYSPTSAKTLRTVAMSGDPAPGRPGGTNFASLGIAVTNSAGRVAFKGKTDEDFDGERGVIGLWSEGSGTLALVAADGDQAPGMPDGTHFSAGIGSDSFFNYVLNNAGELTFSSEIAGYGIYGPSIWAERSGSLSLVAHGGTRAPGLPDGVTFTGVFNERISSAGEIVFRAMLKGEGLSTQLSGGLFSSGSGTLALVARDWEQAPGMPGTTFRALSGESAVLSSTGHIAFHAELGGASYYSQSIWSNRSNSLQPIIVSGDPAPGTGTKFSWLNYPALSSGGHIAFCAGLDTVEGGSADVNSGIWSDGSGSLTLIARGGDQAPGLPTGLRFGFPTLPVINSSGRTAFLATVTGTGINSSNDRGIWSEGFGSLALVAREGDRAPETPSGVVFSFGSNQDHYLNSSGQTALVATLKGAGVSSANDFGIWAQDRAGILRLIAREDDFLEVAAGDLRRVNWLGVDLDRGFNDAGQLAFSAGFTDGTSGVFVSNLVAVPEPTLRTIFATIAVSALSIRMRPKAFKSAE